MHRAGAALLLLLLVSTGLAGCLGAEEPVPQPAAANNSSGPAIGLVSDTTQAKADAAQGEFAKSVAERAHYHDQWSDALELTLMDEEVQSGDSTPPGVPPPQSYFSTFQGGGVGATSFSLPDGAVILPETKEIVLTLTFGASPTVTGMRIGWKNALERGFGNWSETPLKPGESLTIPTTLLENDMPHASVSKWSFRLIPENDGAAPAYWNGTAHVILTIKRDDVLLLAPPHPDLWGAATSQVLFHDSFKASQKWVVFPINAPTPSEGFGRLEIPEGTLVPPHTGVLRITLNWTNTDTTTSALNTRPAIAFSPANSRGFDTPEEVVITGNTLTAVIHTSPKMWDSPYDTSTNWVFYLYLQSDSPTANRFGPFGQVATFDGTIDLHIEAVREDVAS